MSNMKTDGKTVKKSNHQSEGKLTPLEIARARTKQARKNNEQIVFQRLDNKEGTQIIQARCIANEKNTKIALRYVPGVKGVEEGSQGNLSGLKPKAIIMRKGKIVTEDETLIEYLRRHPENSKNGGTLFFEFNAVADAESKLELELIRDEAKYMATKGLSEAQVYALGKVLRTPNIDNLSEAEIRLDLRAYAQTHPREFLDLVESPEPEISALINIAFSENKLEFKNNGKSLAWDGGGTIVELPMLKPDARIPWLVRWMMTSSEGADVLEVLKG